METKKIIRKREDPITKFKKDISKAAGSMNLASMGDLAEREPFYLLKKKQDVEPSSEEEETSSEEEK